MAVKIYLLKIEDASTFKTELEKAINEGYSVINSGFTFEPQTREYLENRSWWAILQRYVVEPAPDKPTAKQASVYRG